LDTAVPEKQAEPGSAGQQAATPTSTPSGTASATVEEAQKALEKMYEVVGHEPSKSALARFGVKRFVELLPEHRGPFIALATKLASITKDKPGTPAFDALVQAVLAS
jgi:hypothetical protein